MSVGELHQLAHRFCARARCSGQGTRGDGRRARECTRWQRKTRSEAMPPSRARAVRPCQARRGSDGPGARSRNGSAHWSSKLRRCSVCLQLGEDKTPTNTALGFFAESVGAFALPPSEHPGRTIHTTHLSCQRGACLSERRVCRLWRAARSGGTVNRRAHERLPEYIHTRDTRAAPNEGGQVGAPRTVWRTHTQEEQKERAGNKNQWPA